MTPAAFKSLVRVRERREQASQLALQAAARALAVAREQLSERVRERLRIESEMRETRERPFKRAARGEQVAFADVQLSQRRVELLAEHLAKAVEAVRKAQAEVASKASAHAQAARERLLAQRKREGAEEQLSIQLRAAAKSRDRKAMESAQEQAVSEAAHKA
jgi:hypothetical protein